MGEFKLDWFALIMGIFVAVVVGLTGFFQLRHWHQYNRKPPKLEGYFVVNPITNNESITKTLTIPNKQLLNKEIIMYFKLIVNDDRKYEKPYMIVQFPIELHKVNDLRLYKHGRNPISADANGIKFVFDEMLSQNKEPLKIPIITKTSNQLAEYSVKVKLGADNIQSGKPIEQELKFIITDDQTKLSHNLQLFEHDSFWR